MLGPVIFKPGNSSRHFQFSGDLYRILAERQAGKLFMILQRWEDDSWQDYAVLPSCAGKEYDCGEIMGFLRKLEVGE